MSLASTMLNGGSIYGGVSVNVSRYGHDTGAMLIATESVEELHDIFLEGFYVTEDAEVQAAMEGVDFESSEYGAVAESASKSVIQRIKEFFKKLWEKIKAFFHNIRKYFDSLFMNAKDFAKKYEKEIKEANKYIKDFTFKMFEYNNQAIDNVIEKVSDVSTEAGKHTTNVKDLMELLEKDSNDNHTETGEKPEITAKLDALKQDAEDAEDKALEKICASLTGGFKAKTYDELDEELFSYFRGGATDADDKTEVDVNDLTIYMKILLNDKASKSASTAESNLKKVMDKANKTINDAEKTVNKVSGKGASNIAEALRYLSTIVAAHNTVVSKMITIWKQVISERQSTYKSLLMAGMTNARKNTK